MWEELLKLIQINSVNQNKQLNKNQIQLLIHIIRFQTKTMRTNQNMKNMMLRMIKMMIMNFDDSLNNEYKY